MIQGKIINGFLFFLFENAGKKTSNNNSDNNKRYFCIITKRINIGLACRSMLTIDAMKMIIIIRLGGIKRKKTIVEFLCCLMVVWCDGIDLNGTEDGSVVDLTASTRLAATLETRLWDVTSRIGIWFNEIHSAVKCRADVKLNVGHRRRKWSFDSIQLIG